VRAEKLAAVTAGLAKLDAAAVEAPPAAEAPPAPAEKTPAPAPKPDAKPAPSDAKPTDEAPDDKTAKGLAAIDRRAKQFRDEQAAERAKLELERAELARLRADVEGRGSSLDEIKKLAKLDPIAALAKLGIDSEDEWENVGRGAYPRTKAGKADPRAAPAVAQTQAQREIAAQIAELRQQQSEIAEFLRTQTAQTQKKAFVDQYLDAAVKAIPTTPTLIGKLHSKSPERARQALLDLGASMEAAAMKADGATKYDPSYTPSHADVIAEYERVRRTELEEQGVDVDALLAPPKPAAAPTTKPKATLDPTSTTGTRPVNDRPTREQKLAAVTLGLKKLEAEQN